MALLLSSGRGAPAAQSSALAQAFGGDIRKDIEPRREAGAREVLTRDLPQALLANVPAFGANGIGTTLDESELGKWVATNSRFKPTTWLAGLSFVAAMLPIGRKARRFFINALVGVGHAKTSAGARQLPHWLTTAATAASPTPDA